MEETTKPAQKNAHPQKQKTPILKPILTKRILGARKRSDKVFQAIKIRVKACENGSSRVV